jgi:hypothetical protein
MAHGMVYLGGQHAVGEMVKDTPHVPSHMQDVDAQKFCLRKMLYDRPRKMGYCRGGNGLANVEETM